MRNDNFRVSLFVSIILHLLLIYYFIFHKPTKPTPPPAEKIISFEIVDVADIINVGKQIQKSEKPNNVLPEEAKKILESTKPEEVKPVASPPLLPAPTPPAAKLDEKIPPVIPAPAAIPEPIKPVEAPKPPAPELPNLTSEVPKPVPETPAPVAEAPKPIPEISKPVTEATKAQPDKPEVIKKPITKEVEKDANSTKLDEMEKELREILTAKPEDKTIENKKNTDNLNKAENNDKKLSEPAKVLEKTPKKSSNELETLLKNLDPPSKGMKEKSDKKAETQGEDQITTQGPSSSNQALSLTEIALIKKQIERSWNLPVGATGINDILIKLFIHFDENGKVLDVRVIDAYCPHTSAIICKAIADSALRAVKNASPIEKLRKDRYDIWQKLNIAFDPADILK